ncbi:MAG: TIGR02757 family protein [Candidatus Krumholzibacteria bacterium]|nr:TIGR02757 family protein [Candidatus Krumholzibacteria bacterium]
MARRHRRGGPLHRALEALYSRYDSREYADSDPIAFLYRYADPLDREIVALVASSLAFGGVRQIAGSIAKALAPMGTSPRRYLLDAGGRRLRRDCAGFRHRWADGADLAALLEGAGEAIRAHGSLGECFLAGLDPEEADVVPALERFAATLRSAGRGAGESLVPDPCRRSACKRLNLMLRWMVRSDHIDPGGWDRVPRSKLVVPLDRHMHRFGLRLGLIDRGQADLRAARELTAAFRAMEPEDPVRYDFALTRLGIRRDDDREALLARLEIPGVAKAAEEN